MLHFVDTDVVLKLASLDLFDESLNVLGVGRSDIRVLGSSWHMLKGRRDHPRHGRQLIGNYGVDGIERALTLLKELSIADSVDLETHDALLKFSDRGIDNGEATLIAAALFAKEFKFVTGDKRCLRALASQAAALSSICARLRGRVITFELLLIALIDKGLHRTCYERYVQARKIDATVDTVLRVRMREDVVLTRDGLASEHSDLATACPSLF